MKNSFYLSAIPVVENIFKIQLFQIFFADKERFEYVVNSSKSEWYLPLLIAETFAANSPHHQTSYF